MLNHVKYIYITVNINAHPLFRSNNFVWCGILLLRDNTSKYICQPFIAP